LIARAALRALTDNGGGKFSAEKSSDAESGPGCVAETHRCADIRECRIVMS
jgi:hypothetical protein